MTADPQPYPCGGTLREAPVACEAVLHMHGQLGVNATHRTLGDVIGDVSMQFAIELAVDERVEVAAVAKMVEAHHGGGNPIDERLLPGE